MMTQSAVSTTRTITPGAFLKYAAMAIIIPTGLLFAAAGTVNWAMGWVWAAVVVVTGIGSRLIVWRVNPDLLAERGQYDQGEGVKSWDRALVLIAGMIVLASWVVAGLDHRLGWSVVPGWLAVAALVVMTLGFVLGSWALIANRFFSAFVRIQFDRAHEVVSSGPYRFIRHPGYSGIVLGYLMTALVLGSWWALIPAGLAGALFAVRTVLEERTLQDELPGYAEYARRVRYRWVPGVW